MKTLTDSINEALKIGKNLSEWSAYSCCPKTRSELKEIIKDRISKEGPNCDLNDIDTSLITDMSGLFGYFDFNGDIGNWNVSNVENMSWLFNDSKLNGDISRWDTRNARNMEGMFCGSWFNRDISDWNVSNIENMSYTFSSSKFNQDISNWKINKDCKTIAMFKNCPIKEEYKPKAIR